MTRDVGYSPLARQQLTELYQWIAGRSGYADRDEAVDVLGVYYGDQDYEALLASPVD